MDTDDKEPGADDNVTGEDADRTKAKADAGVDGGRDEKISPKMKMKEELLNGNGAKPKAEAEAARQSPMVSALLKFNSLIATSAPRRATVPRRAALERKTSERERERERDRELWNHSRCGVTEL